MTHPEYNHIGRLLVDSKESSDFSLVHLPDETGVADMATFSNGKENKYVSMLALILVTKQLREQKEKTPDVESDKRIALVIDNAFLSSGSGVLTFAKHFHKMAKSKGFQLDIISEVFPLELFPKDFDHSGISWFYMPTYTVSNDTKEWGSPEFEKEIRAETMKMAIGNYLEDHKPELMVANSYASTLAVLDFKSSLESKGIKYLSYTHVGDIMDAENVTMLDFSNDVTRAYLDLLKRSKILVASQTNCSQQKVAELIGQEVKLLPEPYYKPKTIMTTPDHKRGVLMVGANYKRKNFKKMFDVLAIAGLPATVLTDKDGAELTEMARQAGVNGLRVLQNIPNDYVPAIAKSHRCMLHLSEIEVLPYVLLECLPHIPCVVDGTVPWAKELKLDGMVKVDPDNMGETINTLTEVYKDPFEYPSLDVEAYQDQTEKAWMQLLKS